jgi:hypothetical protein
MGTFSDYVEIALKRFDPGKRWQTVWIAPQFQQLRQTQWTTKPNLLAMVGALRAAGSPGYPLLRGSCDITPTS